MCAQKRTNPGTRIFSTKSVRVRVMWIIIRVLISPFDPLGFYDRTQRTYMYFTTYSFLMLASHPILLNNLLLLLLFWTKTN